MSDANAAGWAREAAVAAMIFVIAMIVIPPVVAGLAYQSGQAMFWPALSALYTYFLAYTALAALGVSVLAMATRFVVRMVRRRL